jgi:hypothetical protein
MGETLGQTKDLQTNYKLLKKDTSERLTLQLDSSDISGSVRQLRPKIVTRVALHVQARIDAIIYVEKLLMKHN